MAQVIVSFGAAGIAPGGQPVFAAYGTKTEELGTSGTHAPTTITADAGDYARIVNAGTGVVWVTFAATPVAAVEDRHAVLGGATEFFGPLLDGDKASVIDDS